jgi:type II secretory pathway pseudopilin PulG
METRDPWAEARERTREEVRKAFAPRRVVCANCGHEETTAARACSRCGTPYVAMQDPGLSRAARRRIALAALAVVIVLGIAAALIVPSVQQGKRDADARERAAERATFARERKRLARDQRLHSATAKGPPAQLRSELETSITADARARVRAGTLNGPILRTQCSPFRGAGGPPVGKYTCTAVNREIVRSPGERAAGTLGYPFWAIVDFRRKRYSWCKLNPRAGEGSATPSSAGLAVPLPRGCDLTR